MGSSQQVTFLQARIKAIYIEGISGGIELVTVYPVIVIKTVRVAVSNPE